MIWVWLWNLRRGEMGGGWDCVNVRFLMTFDLRLRVFSGLFCSLFVGFLFGFFA